MTRAEDAAEDAEAERQQAECEFRQLFEEKAVYMRRTSAAEVRFLLYDVAGVAEAMHGCGCGGGWGGWAREQGRVNTSDTAAYLEAKGA